MRKPIEEAAKALRGCYGNKPIAPMREYFGPFDGDTAYAVQDANTRYWCREGRIAVGRKIGLTSDAVQKQLGVDQPDFGVLFDDMRIADRGYLDPGLCLQPKAEAEIAFVLRKSLTSRNTTAAEFADAVDTVHASIEVVDSRITDWKITFADTVADNGSSAFFVLSGTGQPIHGMDLWSAGMVMEVNGRVTSVGAGAAALGHPCNAGAWLARCLANRDDPLQSGDIVLSGSLGPMVSISPGDHIRAVIGGIGECEFQFGNRTS